MNDVQRNPAAPTPRRDHTHWIWTILAGMVAAAAGGWLMSLLAENGLYFPLIPAGISGWVMSLWLDRRMGWLPLISGVIGFCGMVWGDALTFNLVDHPGTLNYLINFYQAASLTKILFWGLSFAVGYWMVSSSRQRLL